MPTMIAPPSPMKVDHPTKPKELGVLFFKISQGVFSYSLTRPNKSHILCLAEFGVYRVMKSIELFAGAGGLTLATANAGFDHVAVLEWDRNACNTIRRNLAAGVARVHDCRIVEGDVAKYDFRQHAGSVDFISGGPPCQPFSIGGKHGGMEDQRNMFPHAVRAIREIAPKGFLIENVKGLLRKSFANYYAYTIHQFMYPEIIRKCHEKWTDHHARLERVVTNGRHKGLKYNVVYKVLNAADYGVPQRQCVGQSAEPDASSV